MGQTLAAIRQFLDQAYPPTPSFKLSQIPDQTGIVSIVTGGSSGVGYEIVKALLAENGTVYMAARSKEKADKAIEKVRLETGGRAPIFLSLDLGDLGSVENAAEEFLKKEKRLHVLYNNAGVMVPPIEALTPAGHDLQLGTNVLGHFYLTKLLLPTMQRTSIESGNKQRSRIIFCSSGTHMFVSKDPALALVKDSFKGDTKAGQTARLALGINGLYAQSKFGVIVMAKELARRFGVQDERTPHEERGEVLSIPINPGNLKTDLQRHTKGLFKYLAEKAFLYPAVLGAHTAIYAGTYISDEEAAEIANRPAGQGGYVIPWGRSGNAHECADDENLGLWFWDWLEEQVKGRSAP